MNVFKDQFEFLQAGDSADINQDNEELYNELINEEFNEFMSEGYYLDSKSNVNTIKEALDLLYVTVGYLNITIGPEKAQECWSALHGNNMSKCINGKLVKRDDGKVLKPESYKKLDLSEILNV